MEGNQCTMQQKTRQLSTEKFQKQVVSAAYGAQLSNARTTSQQSAGELWTDEDFANLSIDPLCSGDILSRQKGPLRIFRAYEEPWEKKQFPKKGDDVHAVRVTAKYGGLKYLDCDNDVVGEFPRHHCS